MQIEHSLACIEKQLAKGQDDDATTCEALQHLATAAQAASMDAFMRREGTGW